jgi:serine/threonine protein kinase
MKQCPICLAEYPDDKTTCPRDAARLVENSDWAPNKVVKNKYRIIAQVGRGGMATVYKALHMALDEVRAIKVMDAHLAGDMRFLQRFRQEAQMARKLRQVNVVQVDDLDQAEDGRPFIAMEFVEGLSLRQLLTSKGGPLPLARAIAITRGVAEALLAAHALGMVHRDIKPDNILLACDPRGGDLPKVLDFGLVAMRESSATLSSQLLLTPAYGSPEQWEGKKSSKLDGRADLYSLGMTLYEMLTGRLPFEAKTIDGWMRAHLNQQPEPPSRFNPALSGMSGVDAVVLKLLAKNREQRTSSAQELLGDLNLLEAQYSWGKETVVVRTPPREVPIQPPPPPAEPPRNRIPPPIEPKARPESRPQKDPPAREVAPTPPSRPPSQPPIQLYRPPGREPRAEPARAQEPALGLSGPAARPANPPAYVDDAGTPPGGGHGESEEPKIRVPEWNRNQGMRREGSGSNAWVWVVVGIVAVLASIGLWQVLKPQPPDIESFTAEPNPIKAGEFSRLRWRVVNAETVSVEPGLGVFSALKNGPSDGSVTVQPSADQTYRLVAKAKNGQAESTVTLKVMRAALNFPSTMIYSDDMHSARNWTVNSDPACSLWYSQGGLVIENTLSRNPVTEFCGMRLSRADVFGALDDNVKIEISVKHLKGNKTYAYGLAFAAPQDFVENRRVFYAFMIASMGNYELLRYEVDGWHTLLDLKGKSWPTADAIRQGDDASNRLSVEVRGNTVSFFVNGRYLGRYVASDSLRGYAGLLVPLNGLGVEFSDLLISRLN